MKKIYLALLTLALSGAAVAQTVSIGTTLDLPPAGGPTNTFRSPWSPAWGFSYTQTIYLQSEINTAGVISSLRFNYGGTALANSNQITLWIGKVTRDSFVSDTDWEPITNLTEAFNGVVTYSALPGVVTVDLTTPFTYDNTGNLIIAIHEAVPDFDDSYFHASEVGTSRTIYRVDDELNPDPSNPEPADNIRTKVANIEIVFAAPTPVTLGNISLEKIGGANALSWTTETELNITGFELERSADGISFTTVEFIQSKAENGSSNATLSYNFTDLNPLPGINYYRLKQVDQDGKITYSKVVIAKASVNKFILSTIYPNPSKNEVNVILSSPGNDRAKIFITNIDGKVVFKTTSAVVAGDNKIYVNAASFAAGVYTVKVVSETSKQTALGKFVKQ